MTKKKQPREVTIEYDENKSESEQIAQTYLRPTVMSAATIKGQYINEDKVNMNALIKELGNQVDNVSNGDLSRPEAMLVTQAHTLDALFSELIGRSRLNMGEYLHAAEKFMRLALKAQSQCRTTIEALAELKNPKPYIQNNRAQYQQVNNGAVHSGDAQNATRTRKNKKLANELLENKTNEQEWMDTRTPQTPSGNDKELETVGE